MNQVGVLAGDNYILRLWSNCEVSTSAIKEVVKAVANFFVWQFEIDALYTFREWHLTFEWAINNRRIRFEYAMDEQELQRISSKRFAETIARELRRANQRLPPTQIWQIIERESFTRATIHEGAGNSINLVLDEVERVGDRLIVKGSDLSDRIKRNGLQLEIEGIVLQADILQIIRRGDDCWFDIAPRVERVTSVDYSFYSITKLWTRTRESELEELRQRISSLPQTSALERASAAMGQSVEDFHSLIESASSTLGRQQTWRAMRRVFGERQVEIPESFESLRQGFELIASTPLVTAQEMRQSLADMFKPRAIGDTTCRNNARSPYIRCAVNPCGPCEGCGSYES